MASDSSSAHTQTPVNKASLATAKVVPVFLALVVAYCSYVVVGPLSIEYLLNGTDERPHRIAAGVAIPIVWFSLLVPVAVTWLRLLVVVFGDPGYVPCGDDGAEVEPPPEFWMRDVFVCDTQGVPIWCHHCRTWKPDRAHHNQDTGRCTLKMDHFCPWVGGVVGERSMKFFFQFLAYSWLLSTYGMILLAYFVHEDHSKVQWLVALGLAGFFVLFTLGMVVNTLHMIIKNQTSVEAIGGCIMLAVLLPPELQDGASGLPTRTHTPPSNSGDSERPLTSELDDPSHSSYFSNGSRQRPLRKLARSTHWKGTVTYPMKVRLSTDQPPLPPVEPRTFAILETWPDMNPWDLGTPWRNLATVFGTKLHHWLLPLRHSPCCDHASAVSFYPLGPQFEELLHDVGLLQPFQRPPAKGVKKRKRKLPEGWQHGERPDGWISEKEARRVRRARSQNRDENSRL